MSVKILEDEEQNAKVLYCSSTMMPIGLGVYENNSGEVFIAEMNISLMGMMFGGNVSDVMGDVSNDIGKILEGIVEN